MSYLVAAPEFLASAATDLSDIGSALTALLTSGGHRVIKLVRGAPDADTERRWDPGNPDPSLLRGTDALVHLAGASIAGRFTAGHKRAIYASRITPTRHSALRSRSRARS